MGRGRSQIGPAGRPRDAAALHRDRPDRRGLRHALRGDGLSRPRRRQRVRIGFQKYGTLVLLKSKGLLEEKLKPLGYTVEWTEFPAGPQLLEALNVGAIDYGTTGEAPPIFAQAAGAPLVYVGYEPPAPSGEAILVPADSPLKTVADLKGKNVALNKGSNVHYLLVKALEKAGVSYSDIKTSFLPPADARAAFEKGAVDAWVIWDPFLAAAEAATGARTLADGQGHRRRTTSSISPRGPLPKRIRMSSTSSYDSLGEVDAWVKSNPGDVAAQFSPGARHSRADPRSRGRDGRPTASSRSTTTSSPSNRRSPTRSSSSA